MKNVFNSFLFIFSFASYAQNTFPGSGNAGIGTITPDSKLTIVTPTAGTSGLHIVGQNGDNWFPYTDGKNYLRGTTIISDGAGNVGIGTSGPDSKLHLFSPSS